MIRDREDVCVVCYAGYRGEQEPRRFSAGDLAVEVIEILDRWLDPEHRYFKIRGHDGGIYLLRHDEKAEAWTWRVLTPALDAES
jgi:hypothetical protein